jgi:hypothetical protein
MLRYTNKSTIVLKYVFLTSVWWEGSQLKTSIKTPWPEPASELYRPSDRRLSAKLVPTFAERWVSRSQDKDRGSMSLAFRDLSLIRNFGIQSLATSYLEAIPTIRHTTQSPSLHKDWASLPTKWGEYLGLRKFKTGLDKNIQWRRV